LAKALTRLWLYATFHGVTPQVGKKFSLSAARMNRGHSVRSLAAELGVDARTLMRLERGDRVHPAKAKKVADFFGVQVTDLMPPDADHREAA
jgi:transcriptional regulator with XRE-family HTH domain